MVRHKRHPAVSMLASPSQETAALQIQCLSSKPGSPLDAPLSLPHSHSTLNSKQQILLAVPSKYSLDVRRPASEGGSGLEQAPGHLGNSSVLLPELSAHHTGGFGCQASSSSSHTYDVRAFRPVCYNSTERLGRQVSSRRCAPLHDRPWG